MLNESIDPDMRMMNTAAFIRGEIINAITMLERTIDSYLAHRASTTEKRKELVEHVFATKYVTFESKRLIFNKIINEHNKDFKETELQGIHAKLNYFNSERNIIAHCVLDCSHEAVLHFTEKNEVTFNRYLHGTEKIYYTLLKSDILSKEIYAFVEPIFKIINFRVEK